MTIPKIIASRCKDKILSKYPELDSLISYSKNKNTCVIVDMNTTLPSVTFEGVMKLSVTSFLLLHPLLKQFFFDLKANDGKNIQQSIKVLQEKLKILDLTKNEILLFLSKILIVLAIFGLKGGNKKWV
jgi:hypothetical protein